MGDLLCHVLNKLGYCLQLRVWMV